MRNNSFLFRQQPDWRSYHARISQRLPNEVQSWVDESHSLTQRLRYCYGEKVKVKILFHQWQRPFLNESHFLHLPPQRYSLIREVLLYAEDKPLILARTILPKKTIHKAKGNLSHLGTRPLGEVIFSYPDLKRLQREWCCVNPTIWSPALQQQLNIDQPMWGRRTVYALHQQSLLVSELFLPEVLEC